jgi:tetratricopeptide (TPR) repeat protein
VSCEELRRFVDFECADLERRWRDASPDERQKDRVNHLRKILATTSTYHRIALDLLADPADLTLAYYEITDTVGHLFARYLPPRLPGVSEDEVRRYGRALPEAYVYADELLGELVAAAAPDTTFLLISDHGFYVSEARPATDIDDFGAGAPNWHRQTGVLVAAGPAVRPGNWNRASIFDIAPTVLAWLGLPVAEDMKGSALPEEREPRRLPTYERLLRERPTAAIAADPAADAERIRELVALGYLSPDSLPEGANPGAPATTPKPASPTAPGAAVSPPEPSRAGGPSVGLATEAYNLARIHQRNGEYAEAEKQFRIALEREPKFGLGWSGLAQVQALRGDHAAGFRTLDQGLRTTTDMPPSGLTGLVDEAREARLLPEAEKTLQWLGQTQYRSQSALHSAWGLYFETVAQDERALGAYRNALGIDPLDELAIERTIALLKKKGDVAGARAVLDGALATARGNMASINHLALVSLREGMPDRAEKIFRELLSGDPGNPGLLSNLSAALARQGRSDEAIRTMREALERDPNNAQNQFNLGALLVERGRFAEALAAFEAAERLGLKNPRVYVAISKMRFRGGDLAGAEAALRQSLALDPSHQESRELLAILQQNR